MEFANSFKSTYQLSNGMSVEYGELIEYFGMNGPFVGKISVNGVELDGLFTGPPRLSENFNNLLLPKCEHKFDRKFIFRRERVLFSILVVDLATTEMFESIVTFPLLFIEGMNNQTITVHKANHNQNVKNKIVVDFNMNNFRRIGLLKRK